MKNVLTVYYSRKGENYVDGKIIDIPKGNTKTAAEYINNAVGGDLFEVDTVSPYSDKYTECTKQAAKELRSGARPEIKAFADNMDNYDTVFVGFPNWCGTMPMPMFTFLEHYNFEGKRIIPFCSNEGSGMGRSEHDIKKICKGAAVEKGMSIRGCKTKELENDIKLWAKSFC